MSAANIGKPAPANEIRIGLVLYGGVSLAIYIFGVALEFLRVMRAWEHEDNVYSSLLRDADTKIVVDIISGTSAGGINGVLLAKGLTCGLSSEDFGMLRNLWLEAGDLSALMKPGRPEMAALLDEEFFEEQLARAFQLMDIKANSSCPSLNALDLYVSSTDLHGRVVSGRELGVTAFNKPIESKEYRRMFRLKFRRKAYLESNKELGTDKSDFTADKNPTLVKVCRATSAFPWAFRPVELDKGDGVYEDLLKSDDNPAVFLTDGGVLNNKPFSDTIATIFRRDPLGKVERLLFYVEPDPETYVKTKKNNAEPGFWEVMSKSVVGIPSYQSITNDMRNIKDRNRRIEDFKGIMDGTERIIKTAGQTMTGLDDKGYRTFLEGQLVFKGYQQLKVGQLNTRLQELFLESGLGCADVNSDTCKPIKDAFRKAFQKLAGEAESREWQPPGEGEPRLKDVLGAFDSPYRFRRLSRLAEIVESLYDTNGLGEANRRRIDSFMIRISELQEQNRTVEKRTWNNGCGAPRGWFEADLEKIKLETSVQNLNPILLADNIYDLLVKMMSYSGEDCRGLQKEYDDLTEKGKALARELDEFVKAELPSSRTLIDYPPFERIYTQFEFRDMFIHPVEVIGNLGERTNIDIVRVSPKDATFICSDSSRKLAGDTLFHFGGFLKKEWRTNDIMWGRLDAAELIVRTLGNKGNGKLDVNTALDKVAREILATDNDLSKKAVAPGEDYKRYMLEKYDIGAESLKDIDTATRFRLILDSIVSIRDMLRFDLKERSKASKVTALIDKWLGRVLNFIAVPLTLVVKSLFDKDSFIQTLFSLLILSAWVWGLITVVLFLVAAILGLGWLNIPASLAGTALVVLVIATVFGFLIKRNRK
ncbi:MAG: patatin-like protein [Dehalococcoidales bacterium]|nr:patatin-like protein [Dehalococcoidales bacterium]